VPRRLGLHDGQSAHIDHARFARRAILPQVVALHILIIGITVSSFHPDTRGVRVVTNVGWIAVDADVPVDERHGGGRRNRVVLAPQRLGAIPTMRKRIVGVTVAIGKVHRGDHV